MWVQCGCRLWAFVSAFLRVHWVQVVGAALAILLMLAKMDEIPSFWSLSCFVFRGLLADMPLFSVLGGV